MLSSQPHTNNKNSLFQVVFVVLENLGDKKNPANHWYIIGLNMPEKRFEVLDSLRGEKNDTLHKYSGRVIKMIKEAWDVFYDTSKNQIKDFTTKIIDVPKQTNRLVSRSNKHNKLCCSSFPFSTAIDCSILHVQTVCFLQGQLRLLCVEQC